MKLVKKQIRVQINGQMWDQVEKLVLEGLAWNQWDRILVPIGSQVREPILSQIEEQVKQSGPIIYQR